MSIKDVAALMDPAAPKPGRPATYKKRVEEKIQTDTLPGREKTCGLRRSPDYAIGAP